MRPYLLFIVLIPAAVLLSCNGPVTKPAQLPSITIGELQAHMDFIASDFLRGRRAGSRDELGAAHYIATQYERLGISPFMREDSLETVSAYFQPFLFDNGAVRGKSQNVLAVLPGHDPMLSKEYVVIIAHYDHLGVDATIVPDSIYNGASDDASGTVALLTIAEALVRENRPLKRSVMFMHAGAEEIGTLGSQHFVDESPLPLENIKAVINLDGVSGTDKPDSVIAHNYVYLLVNDSTSEHLRAIADHENHSNIHLLTPSNPNRFNSDNKPFEYDLVPSLYFSTGLTEHYHNVSDNPSTVNYEHMKKVVELVYRTLVRAATDDLPKARAHRADFAKTGRYFCRPCGCASDNKMFILPGLCPDCKMTLNPEWKHK
jgi:hypothetical protein